MSFYEQRILPYITDVALSRKEFVPLRGRVAAELSGEVLEVGFGSGRNVPHYPPAVARVRAVDPAIVGRKLAAKRVEASSIPVEYIGLDGQQLPLDDNCIDHVLTAWTMCTIPDVGRALTEIRRVLRPGGALHFLARSFAGRSGGELAGPAHAAPAADRRRLSPQPAHRSAPARRGITAVASRKLLPARPQVARLHVRGHGHEARHVSASPVDRRRSCAAPEWHAGCSRASMRIPSGRPSTRCATCSNPRSSRKVCGSVRLPGWW